MSKITNRPKSLKIVEDLYPGDIIIARRPGGFVGSRCVVVNIENAGGYAEIVLRPISIYSSDTFSIYPDWNQTVTTSFDDICN